MASRPKIVSYKPNRVLANDAVTVYLKGEEFQSGATLQFGSLAPALTFVSENEVTFNLPGTLSADIYDVVLTNPDGGRSNTFEFKIFASKSAVKGRAQKGVEQRIQPLPPPFQTRTDSQRVLAGNQFNGRLPDVDQERWNDVTGPTQGGRWSWAQDCIVESLEFIANGVEPGAGRVLDSAFFRVHPDGSRVRILGLDGARANDEYVVLSGLDLRIAQDEEIQLITTGATLEMRGSVTIKIDRPYL